MHPSEKGAVAPLPAFASWNACSTYGGSRVHRDGAVEVGFCGAHGDCDADGLDDLARVMAEHVDPDDLVRGPVDDDLHEDALVPA